MKTCTQVLHKKHQSGLAVKTEQFKPFTMGCLQEGLHHKSREVNKAFHCVSARIRAGIRVYS